MTTTKTTVAVYGSLRQGMGNHRVMERAGGEYLHTTLVNGFGLYPYAGTGFPAVGQLEGAKTIVELYEVDDVGLSRLDSLEGFREGSSNNFYERMEVTTELGDTAMIYYHTDIAPDLAAKLIEHGDWCQYVEDNCGC